MCGIVGAVSNRNISSILIQGLKRLEYRGYDSAGLALHSGEKVEIVKREGKVKELEQALEVLDIKGNLGIAHTRWATHGKPSEVNAHPHSSTINNETLSIVHNGIIENFETIKQNLQKEGFEFQSSTDSEVIVHLIARYYKAEGDLFKALQSACDELHGAFAIGLISSGNPDELICARKGSPLIIGAGFGENFIGSDVLALQAVTNRFIFLEDGDTAKLTKDKISIFDESGKQIKRDITEISHGQDNAEKGKYRHFMEKEIFEQGDSVTSTLENRLGEEGILANIFGLDSEEVFAKIEAIQIVACGTSYHSGMVAKYWLEELAGIPCQVEIASEFRYRKKVIQKNSLLITISQSGETADTLSALKEVKEQFLASLCICNVYNSSLVRESDFSFMTNAGAEIGVASTKAFTTQLTALLIFTGVLMKAKSREEHEQIFTGLKSLVKHIEQTLTLHKRIEALATAFSEKDNALFLGRGAQYPIAMEGALKLKEISYIHAEAYAAGELKHGPLALVDSDMPVITVAPNNDLFEKLKSNMQEVASRGGELFVFIDETIPLQGQDDQHVIKVPSVPEIIAPIIYTIPLQLLSYYVALIKGTDVDQPRNLAKSVTVE